jgi:hypothetical protein
MCQIVGKRADGEKILKYLCVCFYARARVCVSYRDIHHLQLDAYERTIFLCNLKLIK